MKNERKKTIFSKWLRWWMSLYKLLYNYVNLICFLALSTCQNKKFIWEKYAFLWKFSHMFDHFRSFIVSFFSAWKRNSECEHVSSRIKNLLNVSSRKWIYKEQSLVLYSDTSVNTSITDLILVIKHFKAFHWLFRRAFVIHLWFTNHTASMRIQQRAMNKTKFNQRILWNKFYFNSQ